MMKAGKYFIGDLYTIPNIHQIIDETKEDFYRNTFMFLNKLKEGTYKVNIDNKKICVDFGGIGCLELNNNNIDTLPEFGIVVDIPYDFEPYEENGVYHFGDVTIDTNSSIEDEEYDDIGC